MNEMMMLTGTSPGGMMIRPMVSQITISEKPSSVEAGKRYR